MGERNGRSRYASVSTWSTTAAERSGSWFAIMLSPHEISIGASSCGTVKIEQRNRIGSSRLISLTKSNSPIGSARSSTPTATSRIQSSYLPTPRALKRFEQIFLSSVWRGGSVSSIDLRTSSCSASSSSSETAPSSDENVSQFMCTFVRSS